MVDLSDKSEKEPCNTCLYTGVATCGGLSLYFTKLALELPESGTMSAMQQAAKNKRFFLVGSAFWAGAGLYRLYLG